MRWIYWLCRHCEYFNQCNYRIWWRHQMETFSALLAICAGNSPVTDEFPAQTPVTRIFDVFFDLRPNKRLGKQSWGWWFETPSCSLWRHCNGLNYPCHIGAIATKLGESIARYIYVILIFPVTQINTYFPRRTKPSRVIACHGEFSMI